MMLKRPGLLAGLIGIVLIMASCSQNNVTVDDSLKKYFDENKGK